MESQDGQQPLPASASSVAAPPPPASALAPFLPVLELRSRVLQALRGWFIEHGFIEVETPVRLATPALELHLDAEPAGDHFLRTSPELHMKRLLAAGAARIFQLGPCFRRGERGRLHNPEYTMLEWYRANATYADILLDTKRLILAVARAVRGTTDLRYQGRPLLLAPVWERLTVAQAFIQYAGWDPVRNYDAARFDFDLVDKVEPKLPREVPVILTDYPVAAAALSRRKPGQPEVAERWELYLAGIEIANAYSELTDPAEQRARFEDHARQRAARGKPAYPLDEEFLADLAHMPPAGGIALGVDRLVMILADLATLSDLLPFRE
ncbi:MAG: EF-P lysine aminoacylase EpmA [Kiritimatiellaeota bacterium]|nr:EF-P lysine aminoacylase EpmA [Kiritimatiellota bacterium]